MRATLAITRVELRRVVQDRLALFAMVILPVLIIIIIGLTFFRPDDLTLGILDRHPGSGGDWVVTALEGAEGVVIEHYDDEGELRRDIRVGKVDGAVLVPPSPLDGRGSAEVVLVTDPTGDPFAVHSTVSGILAPQGQEVTAARFAAEHTGFELPGTLRMARAQAEFFPAVDVRTEQLGAGEPEGAFTYTAPANLVLFVFINTLAVGGTLALSRQLGITRRMLAAPVTAGTVVFGVALSRLVFAVAQSLIIIVLGAVAFEVDWGDPLGVAALVLLFAVLATAAGVLAGAVARSPEQSFAVGIPIGIGMGMLGGAMWPLFIVGDTMRKVGHIVPHAWAMDAWEALGDGAAIGDITGELAVLGGFTVVLLGAAIPLLRHSLTEAPSPG